jgi:tetratricopeptide (TPR) repeat protein
LHSKGVRQAGKFIGPLGLFLFGCLAVCGWHYARVAARFGNPFIGNWDIGTGFNWWQQPGFRTGAGYFSIGRCLTQPFYSAFASFGDGIYSTLWGDGLYSGEADLFHRPPWNYDLMAAGYLFALLPSLAFLAGVCRLRVKCAREPAWFLVLSLISLFGALLVYYSLEVPSYAASKAFYASGALVPFCALAAAGWDWLATARALRLVLFVSLGVWAANSYASFWIRHEAEHTQFLEALVSADVGRHDQAVLSLMHLLSKRPQDVQAAQLLSRELCRLGRVAEGRQIAELALQWADGDADCHLARGAALAHQKIWEQAVAEARRAIELAPDHPWASEHLADWLLRAGHTDEAIEADRNALRINPTRTQLHFYLGLGLATQGQTAGALEAYRRALGLDPKFAPALNGLALLLATCTEPSWRDGAEAVRLATRACEVEMNPRHLQTLAIALAAAGRFNDAGATAQKAADTARAAGDQSEASAAEQLLKRLKPDRTYDLPNPKQ